MAEHEVSVAELARKASGGDENAFNELYRVTRDRAYFVAYTITHNEQDALEILQDSYLKAWRKLSQLEEPEVCAAWINTIVGNTAKDFVKKRRPALFEPLDDDHDPLSLLPEEDMSYVPDAALDTAELKRLIMKIIDALPEDQRLCVLMYYYDDMPVAGIAEALEIPEGTVKKRLYLARGKIKKAIEELEASGDVKLYSAAPIPLLIWLLRNVPAQVSKKLPPIILGGTAAAAGTAAVVGGIAAGGAAVAAAGSIASAGTVAASGGAVAGESVAAAATAAVAGTSAAGAAASAGGIVAGIVLPKVIAAVAAIAVVGSGAIAVAGVAKSSKPLPANAGTTITAYAGGTGAPGLTSRSDPKSTSPAEESGTEPDGSEPSGTEPVYATVTDAQGQSVTVTNAAGQPVTLPPALPPVYVTVTDAQGQQVTVTDAAGQPLTLPPPVTTWAPGTSGIVPVGTTVPPAGSANAPADTTTAPSGTAGATQAPTATTVASTTSPTTAQTDDVVTVIFVCLDGDLDTQYVQRVSGKKGTMVKAPQIKSPPGWSTVGWNPFYPDEPAYSPNDNFYLSHDTTYLALYERNVTFTFYTGGATTTPTPITTTDRILSAPGAQFLTQIQMPAAPTFPGYSFAGWRCAHGIFYSELEFCRPHCTEIHAAWGGLVIIGPFPPISPPPPIIQK